MILEPITLSASQISTWRACKRQWAFKYIERIETESSPAQLLGTETENEQLQPYLLQGRAFEFTTKDGRPRPSGEIAATALPYLPKPMTRGLEMQRHFLMPSPTWVGQHHSGVSYQGYIDLWHPLSFAFPGFETLGPLQVPVPGVGDFKTTSDLKWAKNEKTLLVDVQAMLYATHALFTTRAPAVDLGWIYMQTNGTRKAKRTKLRVFPDHVAEQFQAIDETGQEIARVRREGNKGAIKPLDLEPSPDHCGAFGGCPFQSKCNLSPSQIIDASAAKVNRLLGLKGIDTMTMQNGAVGGMSMLDQLRAKKAASDQGVSVAPAPHVAQPLAAPVPAQPSLLPRPIMSAPTPTPAPIAASPAPVTPAAPPIIGVATDGTNVYAHQASMYTMLGQAADGRNVYELKPAAPVVTPVLISHLPPPVADRPMLAIAPNGAILPATAAPPSSVIAQPINPPESSLPPAPIVDATTKRKPGRPRKEGAPETVAVATAYVTTPSIEDAIAYAKAMRAGCDAFLAALGES